MTLLLGLALALLLAIALAQGSSPPPRKMPGDIAPYPPMQWHSWGLFTHEDLVTEANMLEMAEALVSPGFDECAGSCMSTVPEGMSRQNLPTKNSYPMITR